MKTRPLDYSICKTYTELDDRWDEGLPTDHFLSSKNVSLGERSKIENTEYRYVSIHKGSKKIAQVYFQVLHLQPNYIALSNPVWRNLSCMSISIFKPKLLVCGHLFRHEADTVYFHDSSINDYLQAKIIYEACRTVLKECSLSALLIKDLSSKYDSYLLNHADDCKAMKEDVSMRLRIHPDWKSFDDYLLALKHKYKQRAKKILKKASGLEIRSLSDEDIQREAQEISDTYHQLIEKQMIKMGRINVDFLKNLKISDPNFEIYGIYDAENFFVGFFSYFRRGRLLDMFYIGMDGSKNKQYSTYFNILYWGLQKAIEADCEMINYGRTALDPKASLGCEPYYSQNYYSLKSPIFSNITYRAQQRFIEKQGEVWEIRKPFNATYYESLQQKEYRNSEPAEVKVEQNP